MSLEYMVLFVAARITQIINICKRYFDLIVDHHYGFQKHADNNFKSHPINGNFITFSLVV